MRDRYKRMAGSPRVPGNRRGGSNPPASTRSTTREEGTMSTGLRRDEIAARVEADGEVTPQEFVDTVAHLDRWMIQHGHFPGTLYALAVGMLAETVDSNTALAVLADVATFAEENR